MNTTYKDEERADEAWLLDFMATDRSDRPACLSRLRAYAEKVLQYTDPGEINQTVPTPEGREYQQQTYIKALQHFNVFQSLWTGLTVCDPSIYWFDCTLTEHIDRSVALLDDELSVHTYSFFSSCGTERAEEIEASIADRLAVGRA